jgi:hypothetical protein
MRHLLHEGAVTPIGEAPDGLHWTGFLVDHPQGQEHIVFNGVTRSDTWSLPTRASRTRPRFGNAELEAGRVTVCLERPNDFVWVSLS